MESKTMTMRNPMVRYGGVFMTPLDLPDKGKPSKQEGSQSTKDMVEKVLRSNFSYLVRSKAGDHDSRDFSTVEEAEAWINHGNKDPLNYEVIFGQALDIEVSVRIAAFSKD